MSYDRSQFGKTVREDFLNRRTHNDPLEHGTVSMSAASALATRALGHPDYERLAVGQRRTAPMTAVFLDLSQFTRRTFWDDQEESVDLAHAVLTGFIEVIAMHGGHPLGLRGDGLFAGFSPGNPAFTASMALTACAFALDGVENEVNPWLERRGMARIQARAGADYGDVTFVRTGNAERSEVNLVGFAANFAAKCEKQADSWEVVVGQGLRNLMPTYPYLIEHDQSPKTYTRGDDTRYYRFYDYRWRRTVPHLPGVAEALAGRATTTVTATR